MTMRTFEVFRRADESGVSGTGKVLEGVVFSDGHCVVRWVAMDSPGHSGGDFDSFGTFLAVHVGPHQRNRTRIVFNDGTVYEHVHRVKGKRK